MKIYVRAMSLPRKRALIQAGSYAETIIYHIIKILAYHEIRENDVNHWIDEIADCLYEVDQITIKPKNNKLKEDDLMDTTFSAMGDDLMDYQRELRIFLMNNRKGYFNYGDKESYPDFEITHDLKSELMDCCLNIIDTTIPMLIDKQDHSKEEYKTVLADIFKNYI